MGSRQLLRDNRDFRLFWMGQSLSEYGSQLTQVALPLVAVVSLGASAAELGVLTMLQRISFPVIGLFAGVWVDRLNRRRLLRVTDLGQAAVLALVPLAWSADLLSLPVLLAVALAAGALFVFFEIGYFSYVPNLVRPQDLLTANTSLQTSSATAMIIGPTLAGVLVTAIGAPATLLFDVGTFLVSFGCLSLVRERATAADPGAAGGQGAPRAAGGQGARPPMLADIRAGVRRVFGTPLLRALAEMSAIYLFFYTAFQALVVLFLVDTLGMSGTLVGLFFAAFGVGVIAGALVGPVVAGRFGVGPAIAVAAAAGDLAAVVTAVLARESWAGWTMAAGAAVLMGIGTQITTVNSVSIRQALTESAFQGRVNGTMRVIAWSVTPLGGLFGGLVGGWLGVRTGLAVAAAGTLLAVLRICLSPVVRLRTVPTGPDATGSELDPAGSEPDPAGSEPVAARSAS